MKHSLVLLLCIVFMSSCNMTKNTSTTTPEGTGSVVAVEEKQEEVAQEQPQTTQKGESTDMVTFSTTEIKSQVGSISKDDSAEGKDAIKAVKGLDKPGNIAYENTVTLDEGTYAASFALKLENPETKEVVAGIYVDGINNLQEGYSKEIYVKDFQHSRYNVFTLKFNVEKPGTELMPWIYYTGESTLWLDTIKIEKIDEKINYALPSYETLVFEEEELGRKTGKVVDDEKAINKKAVLVEEGVDAANHIAFGPYSEAEVSGNHKAAFILKTDDNTNENIVAKIEVFNPNGNGVNKSLVIRGTDFSKANEYQNFELNFERTDQGSMEYRIYAYASGKLWFDNVTVIGPLDKTKLKVKEEAKEEPVIEEESTTQEVSTDDVKEEENVESEEVQEASEASKEEVKTESPAEEVATEEETATGTVEN